jgi:hypothetical protein
MTNMDTLFSKINKYKLTVPVSTVISGKKLKGKNELPLISQSLANSIATVGWALASPRGQENIQKTLQRSVNRKFFPYLNAMARGNRKSLHHVYEWDRAGVTAARLFDLKIPSSSRGKSNFSMKVEFRPSKSLVPLTDAQATPNENTGAVVKRKHVFYNKAMVMEYGMSVVIEPKGDKMMAFDNPAYYPGLDMSALSFTSKPVHVDYSQRPTHLGLTKAVESFFSTTGQRDAEESMTEYSRKVTRAASKASLMINVVKPSDEYAKAVASKVAESLVVL